jgi:ParB family chromosome partitioning protein
VNPSEPAGTAAPSAVASRLASLATRLTTARTAGQSVITVPVESVTPNPNQPRKHFDPARLERLAVSIRTSGVIQPIVVRALDGGRYELIAGERRWRASKLACLATVPCIVRDVTGTTSLALALIENLDREDMTPLDEALGVADLVMQTSVSAAAEQLGHNAQWVSKRKRIADAPDFVREFILRGTTTDIEALYELAKLADEDPDAARTVIEKHGAGAHLRRQIKAAAKPLVSANSQSTFAGDVPECDASPKGEAAEAEGEQGVAGSKPLAESSSAPLSVDSVVRRDRVLLLLSAGQPLAVDFSETARTQLIRLLTEH